MPPTRKNRIRLVCVAGMLLSACGCTSIPERQAFAAIHREPYDVVTNNCQRKAREYVTVLVRAGYDAKLVHVMTRTAAHMLVQVRDGDRLLWLDPTAGRRLPDLEAWEYYRIDNGPVLPVVRTLSNSEKRALDSCVAVVNGAVDAELIGVYVGRDANWGKVPEEKWADYSALHLGILVARSTP